MLYDIRFSYVGFAANNNNKKKKKNDTRNRNMNVCSMSFPLPLNRTMLHSQETTILINSYMVTQIKFNG